jgi:endo-1,4-beta-xylanase
MMQPTGGMGQGHMFTDVATGDWFAPMAENMASRGFMGGFTDGTFGPDQPLTRGQFAGIMARMMNVQPLAGTSFSDTNGFWGAGMVEAMTQMGIITGHTDGTFGPYDTITREQMAAIMDRAWQARHGAATSADMTAAMAAMMGRLSDAGSSWAADHIAWMMQTGVINGDSSGMFRPGDMTNRAEASAMMWRWFAADQAQS